MPFYVQDTAVLPTLLLVSDVQNYLEAAVQYLAVGEFQYLGC